jgi:septal ring-binding cell division protein DamX
MLVNMEKELYNELVDKLFITDVTLTLDDINNKEVKLEDIITQPAAYSYYAEKLNGSQVEPTEPAEVNVVEPTEPVEVEPTEPAEEEEIIVDEADE